MNLFLYSLLILTLVNFNSYASEEYTTKTIVYKKIGNEELKINILSPKNISLKTPTAVLIHGGGWVKGAPELLLNHAKYFTSRGMVSALVEYRLIKSTDEKQGPFNAIEDVQSAIKFLRNNSIKYNIDPDKIVAVGASAGGHLSAVAANIQGTHSEEEFKKRRPNALVLFNPVYDNGPNGFGYFYSDVRKNFKAISPIDNINKSEPPVIVFLGDDDIFIPVETACRYHKSMQEKKNISELYVYSGQKHGFFYKKNRELYNDTLHLADLFLQKYHFLKAMPAQQLAVKKFDSHRLERPCSGNN